MVSLFSCLTYWGLNITKTRLRRVLNLPVWPQTLQICRLTFVAFKRLQAGNSTRQLQSHCRKIQLSTSSIRLRWPQWNCAAASVSLCSAKSGHRCCSLMEAQAVRDLVWLQGTQLFWLHFHCFDCVCSILSIHVSTVWPIDTPEYFLSLHCQISIQIINLGEIQQPVSHMCRHVSHSKIRKVDCENGCGQNYPLSVLKHSIATKYCAVSLAVTEEESRNGGKRNPTFVGLVTFHNSEPLPSSRVRSRFLPCLWAGDCLEEWPILAPVWTVSHANWEAAGPSSIPVENWILCPFWTTWPPVFTFFC